MSDKVRISLELAQDIGLVPKADLFQNHGKVLGIFTVVRRVSEDTYRQRREEIVSRHCVDKSIMLCEFSRDTVLNAVRGYK